MWLEVIHDQNNSLSGPFLCCLKTHCSKICLKRPLKKDQKLAFKTNYLLMQVKSIAECSRGSILQYFRPSLSYHLSLRHLFLSIFRVFFIVFINHYSYMHGTLHSRYNHMQLWSHVLTSGHFIVAMAQFYFIHARISRLSRVRPV